MIVPKFSYGGGPTVFTPAYPAKNKIPLETNHLVAVKHDSITSQGNKQSNTERVEEYQELEFPFVASSDLASFRALVLFGMNGGVITYYPDSTDSATHDDFYLEDTDWRPKFEMPGVFSFMLQLRKKV